MTAPDTRFFKYLPVSDRYIAWGLYVTGGGVEVTPPSAEYPPQDHPALYTFKYERGRILPEYQIHYIRTGAGTFSSKPTGTVRVKPGTIFLLFPDVWHTYRPDADVGWTEYWVSLNGSYLYHLRKQQIISPRHAVIYTGLHKSILRPFEKLVAAIKSQPRDNSLMFSVVAYEILVAATEAVGCQQRPAAAGVQTYDDRLVNGALELIWSHSHRKISVGAIAEALATTRRTLIRRFRAVTGRTVSSEIVRCRLERAKRLLCETNIPIKQISYKVGFASPERLSKVFRRELNTSPKQYRKTAVR